MKRKENNVGCSDRKIIFGNILIVSLLMMSVLTGFVMMSDIYAW